MDNLIVYASLFVSGIVAVKTWRVLSKTHPRMPSRRLLAVGGISGVFVGVYANIVVPPKAGLMITLMVTLISFIVLGVSIGTIWYTIWPLRSARR